MTDPITEAAEVRKSWAAQTESILADEDLNDEARARKLDEGHASTTVRLRELQTAHRESMERSVSEARAALYKAPGCSPEQMRVALDRAEQVTDPGEAARLMRRSLDAEDAALARALAIRAADQGWGAVRLVFTDADPDGAADVAAYAEATAQAGDRGRRLMESMVFSEPARPRIPARR